MIWKKKINTIEDMVFKTKFKPGDIIFFVHDDRIVESRVQSLRTSTKKDSENTDRTFYRLTSTGDEFVKKIEIPESKGFISLNDILENIPDTNKDSKHESKKDLWYEFETNFKIGETVFFMSENKLCEGIVKNISLSKCGEYNPVVHLEIMSISDRAKYTVCGDECFKSKEGLMLYLEDHIITCL